MVSNIMISNFIEALHDPVFWKICMTYFIGFIVGKIWAMNESKQCE